MWAQHRWQPGAGFTIDTGLRWDRQSLPGPVPDATANFSPRFGVAWSPDRGAPRPLVMRAGFGLFFDRYPLAFLNQAVQRDGVNAVEQYLAGPAAAGAFAFNAGGALAAPLPGEPLAPYQVDRNFPTTHSRKFTAGVEKGLDADTKLTAEYSAVRGFHLPRIRNIAGSLPPVYNLEQTARSSYQGLSISLERRLVRELSFLAGYSVSRSRDDASDYDEQPLDPFDISKDWALSRQHQAHRFVASALFEPPVDDLEFLPKSFREALEDFIISPIFSAGSGRPLNALLTTDAYRTGAFPISARPAGVDRNPNFAPGTVQLDLRLMKGFWVKDGRAILQVGVEGFNLLNHSNPLRSSPFYQAGDTPLGSYGQRLETLNARQIQFMAQFEY